MPEEVFEEYLEEIRPRYTAETYNLLTHNCNNFSNEVVQFLVGASVPDYILQLPNEVQSSPMGALICKIPQTNLNSSSPQLLIFLSNLEVRELTVLYWCLVPMIQNIESTMRAGGAPQVPQFVNPFAAPAPATARPSVPKTSAPDQNRVRLPASSTGQAKAKAPEPATDMAKPVSGRGEKEAGAGDPLGDARSRVQEEITKEFAAIMATGTLRASEAAALATRRVMEKHGRMNTPMK